MHRITVHYSMPADPEAFDARYAEGHVPLCLPIPGLRGFSWSKVTPMGGEQTIYMVAQLDFDDRAAMEAAAGSPEMVAAGKDAAEMGVPSTAFSGDVQVATVPNTRL